MDFGDYYWVLYRDYYGDPFPHSLLSTRQFCQETGSLRHSPGNRARSPQKVAAINREEFKPKGQPTSPDRKNVVSFGWRRETC